MANSPRDTRGALLDAVDGALERDGLAGLSVRKVAALAGVSHAAPGALFGDRAGLLTAYAVRAYERLTASMTAQTAHACDAREALQGTGRGYIAFALEEPEAFRLMFRHDLLRGDDAALLTARDAAHGVLTDAIARAVAEGLVPPERAGLVSLGAWSIAHGYAALALSGALSRRAGGETLEALARAVTALFVDATLAPVRDSEPR